MNTYRTEGDGRWFPADRQSLHEMITGFLSAGDTPAAKEAGEQTLLGGIVPHAGLVFSGGVAGATFQALRRSAEAHGMPDLVVILGFSHQQSFRGLALLEADRIRTPLGDMAVDTDTCQSLARSHPAVCADTRLHQGEHSAENQLPFVQVAFPGVPVVVGLVGGSAAAAAQPLAEPLHALGQHKRILLLASTDLLHDPDYAQVVQTDQNTLTLLERLDYEGLTEAWSPQRQICCGIAPVSVLLTYARKMGCRTGHVLSYQNSGDIDPASRGMWVVGYGSVVYGL